MQRALILLVVLALPRHAHAANHGPAFGLATPTNSQGEWSFDQGVFDRTTSLSSQASVSRTGRLRFYPASHPILYRARRRWQYFTSTNSDSTGRRFRCNTGLAFSARSDEGRYSHRKHGLRWLGGSWPTVSIHWHQADQYSGLHDRRGHGACFAQSLRMAGCGGADIEQA